MKLVKIQTEYITLGQFLKYTSIVNTGAEAKYYLQDQDVYVNGIKENRRGRKLYKDDEITINNEKYVIR